MSDFCPISEQSSGISDGVESDLMNATQSLSQCECEAELGLGFRGNYKKTPKSLFC